MKSTTFSLPLRTVILYLVLGSLWILLSDHILYLFVPAPKEVVIYQSLKGWFFILISGTFLYMLLTRELDIRRQAEHEQKLSEQRFRLLFEDNHTVMMLIEPVSGIIRKANTAAATFYRYPLSELCGMNINDLNQLSSEEVYAERMKALKEERNYFNFLHRLSNGEIRSVEVHSAPMEVDGETLLFSIIHDTTEYKKAEQSIRYQARLLENVNDAIIASDANYILQSWNRGAEKIYGWRAEEVIGRKGTELLQTQFPEMEADAIRKQIAELGSYLGEATQLRQDGERIPVEIATIVLHDEAGKINGYVSVNRDITERKRVEESKAQLAAIVESSNDAIIAKTLEGIVTSWNKGAERMYGYTRSEMLGRELSILIPPDLPDDLPSILRRVRTGEDIDEYETVRVCKDGKRIHVSLSISSIRDPAGTIIGASTTARDITERKKAEEDLRALNDTLEQRVTKRTEELRHTNAELERANHTKDEFLAMMSHELRTPLTSILGLSETLIEQQRGPLNQKQIQSVQWISSSGHHLLSLINDILDVSKIEAGKVQLRPDVASIKEVCESSLNFIKETAIRKSITIDFDQDPSVTALKADPQRLKQILVNLLSNAVKFTPERGNVSLQVFTNEQRDQVQFVVSDTGIGIASRDLPKLFTPFTQVDSSLSRQHEGTGLGLVLVFKYTEMHGGSVQVESEVGRGSRFTINLPIGLDRSDLQNYTDTNRSVPSETQRETETTGTQDLPSHKTILLAEDNETSIFTVGDYLEGRGYHVVVARDGFEAVEMTEAASPDLILMDIQMPVMDGLEAIGVLRKNPRFTTTPIIALTALAMPGDRERCLSAGADEYLSKPVSLKGLVKTIDNLLRRGDD